MDSLIGQTVSHYRILEKLGGGGMGVVYKAVDTRLKRTVALKFLPPELTLNPEAKERFINEAQAASALQHANICVVHDIDETPDGQLFINMEYLEGETLRTKIERGPLTLNEVVDIALQVAQGLSQAHEHGIIHRDVKAANIVITGDRVAKIIDFGLAKLCAEGMPTQTGTALGTIPYMPPEILEGKPADARSDVFSFGVVLYEMITGRLPFRGEHESALIYSILNQEPEPLETSVPNVPSSLHRIVAKALEKDLDRRYRSATDMLEDLKSTLTAQRAEKDPEVRRPSIAVLPFEDMSPAHDQEYFCDGVAEEIINALSHISDMRVIARNSAFAFKGKQNDARSIGRTLGVEKLLTGSVRKAMNNVRVTVQLVDPGTASNVWSERYDRSIEDIFAIQDSICLSVVEKLKATLLRGEKAQLVKRRASAADAYTLYLEGRFFFNQRTESSLRRSVECYLEAIAVDPRFALAHAGLATSYVTLGSRRWLPQQEAYEDARRAAATALCCDNTLCEVHVASAYVKLKCDWDWQSAESALRAALAICPSNAEAHHLYAHYLQVAGRFDDSLEEIDRALEIEPLSPNLNSCAVQVLFYARQLGKAIRVCRVAMELAPDFTGLYGWLGIATAKNGNPEGGITILEKGLTRLPDDGCLLGFLGYACGLAGRRARALSCLDQLIALREKKFVDPYYIAWPLTALGEDHSASIWLRKAYDEHSEWIPWVGIDPLLEDIHSDGEFRDLLHRLKLPPEVPRQPANQWAPAATPARYT